MTAIGIALGWLALRVTVVAAMALALVAVAARRSARSAVVILAGGMILLLLVTLAPLCPLPETWCWTLTEPLSAPNAPMPAGDAENRLAAPLEQAAEGKSLAANLIGWLRSWDRMPASETSTQSWGWSMVVCIYLLGVVIAAARLLLGWRALAAWLRRSRALTDPALLKLGDELCATLDCGQHVELREVEDFGPAATLGWRRPIILLGVEWRGWSDEERRAVFAHELAHVRHRDFLVGLLAGFCRMLHFYHPLVRWLTAQMRWRQEVAADDLAATAAGGRPTYLKALARLALQLPARTPAAVSLTMPAMTGGILLRRIDMLRRSEQRPLRSTMRALAIALLAVTALGASAWRGPAQPPSNPAPAAPAEPFEIGYIAPESKGIVAVRPSVWMAQSGMDKVANQVDELFQEWKKIGIAVPDIVRPENIEQIVASFQINTTGTGKPRSRSLVVGTSSLLVRFHKDVDGAALLRPLAPDMKLVRKGDVTVHDLGKVPMLGPAPSTLFQLDRRTILVFVDMKDGAADAVLERVAAARKRNWGTGWSDVVRAPFAVVYDNSDSNLGQTHAKDLETMPETKEMIDDIRFAAFGIELGDGRPMRMVIDAKSTETPKKLEATAVKLLRDTLEQEKEEKGKERAEKEDAADQIRRQLLNDFVERRQVRIDGTRLQWLVFSPIRVRDLIGADGLPLGSSK